MPGRGQKQLAFLAQEHADIAPPHHGDAQEPGLLVHPGLKTNLKQAPEPGDAGRTEYRKYMALADAPRQGDRDGRGNLSEAHLVGFAEWFLKVCLDQISYMSGVFELDTLSKRLERHVLITDGLSPESNWLLQEALIRGEFERGAAPRLTGLPERSARRVLKELTDAGLLASDTPKGPVSLRFPSDTQDTLFPKLFA